MQLVNGPALIARLVKSADALGVTMWVDSPAASLITDDSGPIAIAGVMGGAATEIDPTSSDIVLEAAHFDPASVAYTARRHRLPVK